MFDSALPRLCLGAQSGEDGSIMQGATRPSSDAQSGP